MADPIKKPENNGQFAPKETEGPSMPKAPKPVASAHENPSTPPKPKLAKQPSTGFKPKKLRAETAIVGPHNHPANNRENAQNIAKHEGVSAVGYQIDPGFNSTDFADANIHGRKDKVRAMSSSGNIALNPDLDKTDPIREKIMKQGFAPKGWKPEDGADVPEANENEPKNPKDSFEIDDEWDWEDGSFLVIKDKKDGKYQIRGYGGEEEWVDETELKDRISTARKVVNGINPYYASEPDYEEEEEEEYDPDDEPGSAVVTPKLKDFAREYLSRDGELTSDSIDHLVDMMSKDHKTADFYRKAMKEEYDNRQRERASKLFGTDLPKSENENENQQQQEEYNEMYDWNAPAYPEFESQIDYRTIGNQFKLPKTSQESEELMRKYNYTGPGIVAFQMYPGNGDPNDFSQKFPESFYRFKDGRSKFYEDPNQMVWDVLRDTEDEFENDENATVKDVATAAAAKLPGNLESNISRILNAILFAHFYFGSEAAFGLDSSYKKMREKENSDYRNYM